MHLEVELIWVFGSCFLLQCLQALLFGVEILCAKYIVLHIHRKQCREFIAQSQLEGPTLCFSKSPKRSRASG
jgi:hypothetical protein